MTKHAIFFTRGADKISADPFFRAGENDPGGRAAYREIRNRVRANRRLLSIFSALATGWLPWGVMWFGHDPLPCLTYVRSETWLLDGGGKRRMAGGYPLCCGHVLRVKEAQLLVDEGLLMAGPDDADGRPSLVISAAGRLWLSANWR